MLKEDDERPRLLARFIRRALLIFYRIRGWKAEGVVPEPRKFVLIAAPHTSNWDFVNFIGLTEELPLRPHFMGKLSLFRWPLSTFMRQVGGIPVDRNGSHNYVQAMVDEFARRKEFILTIAPEGTRSKTRKWRTGFYHIAVAAKVPMVIGFMDYSRKVGGLGPLIWPTGDFRADMTRAFETYRGCVAKFPDRAARSVDDIVGDGA